MFQSGVDAMCAERYSDSKYKFKLKWFIERGGQENEQEIRQQPPTDMSKDDWDKQVDYYMNEKSMRRSKVNTSNRSKQPYPSMHGSRAYVEYRHARHQETGQYPSLIEGFGNMHQKDGTYNSRIAQQQHEAMQQLWDAQSNNPNPMSEEQIMEHVLGSRRGHNRGRGRIVRGTSSSDSTAQSQAPGRVYTQAEVDAMFAAQQSQMQSQLQAFAQTLSAQLGFSIPVPSPTPTPMPPSPHQSQHNDENTDDNPYA